MGDTLGELVKCKTSKIYPTTKNLFGPLAGFQRLWLDISGLSAFSRVNQAYPPSRPDSRGIS
jgi:hypothetical protein